MEAEIDNDGTDESDLEGSPRGNRVFIYFNFDSFLPFRLYRR
jgi:hypothetical protein